MLKLLHEDCCRSNPTLPHKLSATFLCPRCEETPALRRLVPQTRRGSSRVTLPNWCSKKNSETTSHSVWWTEACNKLDAHRLRRKYRATVNTNQDLVAWPRNIHFDTDSRQSKLRLELVHQLITSARMQDFNEGGKFRHNPKVRVHCSTLFDNDVLGKRVLPVSHDQRSLHYLLPLSLHLFWTHDIPLIIQHFPAWRLQSQKLVTGEMFAAPEVSQNFMVTISQYRDVLAPNTAEETLGFVATSVSPVTKNCPKSLAPSFLHFVRPFAPQLSPGLTHVPLIATCVTGVAQPKNSTGRLLLYLLQPAQDII